MRKIAWNSDQTVVTACGFSLSVVSLALCLVCVPGSLSALCHNSLSRASSPDLHTHLYSLDLNCFQMSWQMLGKKCVIAFTLLLADLFMNVYYLWGKNWPFYYCFIPFSCGSFAITTHSVLWHIFNWSFLLAMMNFVQCFIMVFTSNIYWWWQAWMMS